MLTEKLDVCCKIELLLHELGKAGGGKQMLPFISAMKPHRTELYQDVPSTCWPIVYSPDYNITFMGLEKLHPFDAGKWGKVIDFLKEKLVVDDLIVQAREATEDDLLVVHTRRYLNKLKWSFVVATITEIPPVLFLPNFLVQRKVLKPLRTQTGGTIMAGKLAVDRGWAINVGGGFHHCSSDKGGGFCAYADITLAIKFLFERVQGVSKATIIDLDAHQGNGHERDFMDDSRVYIMDAYNRYIYPGDGFAKRAIKRKVELEWGTEDTEYLQKMVIHWEDLLFHLRSLPLERSAEGLGVVWFSAGRGYCLNCNISFDGTELFGKE
uniref:Histone deacetylase 11 n=1 Tax=Apteryx owenii TaxID=8824 RepID=A0A8B9QB71_APTOW